MTFLLPLGIYSALQLGQDLLAAGAGPDKARASIAGSILREA
jgi:hypothetical protein